MRKSTKYLVLMSIAGGISLLIRIWDIFYVDSLFVDAGGTVAGLLTIFLGYKGVTTAMLEHKPTLDNHDTD